MNDKLYMVLIFVVGLAMGVLFFGGLWLTVKKAVTATNPALVIFASFICRMGIIMIGFYLVGKNNWQHLLIALFGFIIARLLVIHFTKAKTIITEKEATLET